MHVTWSTPPGCTTISPDTLRRARRGERATGYSRTSVRCCAAGSTSRSSVRCGSTRGQDGRSSSGGGSLEWDYLVIATGARLVPEQVPGLVEGSHVFYSLGGRGTAARGAAPFRGGRIRRRRRHPVQVPAGTRRVHVHGRRVPARPRDPRPQRGDAAVTPQPSVHDRERVEVDPADHGRRGIELVTFFNVEAVDPAAGIVASLEGEKREYDLLVLVPPQRAQQVVIDSGLGTPVGGCRRTARRSTSRA